MTATTRIHNPMQQLPSSKSLVASKLLRMPEKDEEGDKKEMNLLRKGGNLTAVRGADTDFSMHCWKRKRPQRRRPIVLVSPCVLVFVLFFFCRNDAVALSFSVTTAAALETDTDGPNATHYSQRQEKNESAQQQLLPQVIIVEDFQEEKGEGDSSGGLVWSHLSVHVETLPATTTLESVTTTRTRATLPLLQSFSGNVPNGQVCGILGPSGAGKSTFLNALAGGGESGGASSGTGAPWLTGKRVTYHGSVWRYRRHSNDSMDPSTRYNNHNDPFFLLSPIESNQIAWLQQRTEFFSQLTVRETLDLAAFLEYTSSSIGSKRDGSDRTFTTDPSQQESPREGDAGFSRLYRDRRVTQLLERLSLWPAAHRPTYQLSGGERRRLAMALEFLSSDKVLLLADEPTTGLDSSMSVQVLKLIKRLCRQQDIPCLVSLHQPRSLIWNALLDQVILLAPHGRVVYHGRKDEAVAYFAALGYPCPPATNPAEFLVDLVSLTDPEDAAQTAQDESRIAQLAAVFREKQQKQQQAKQQQPEESTTRTRWSSKPHSQHHRHHVLVNTTLIRQQQQAHAQTLRQYHRPRPLTALSRFAALLRRSWRQNSRNHLVNLFRLVFGAGNAILLSAIFPTVTLPVQAKSLADRVALLSFAAINMAMLSYMKTINLFAQEKPVVQREQQRQEYSAAEYLLAKIVGELPLDASFAVIFTTLLKRSSGLVIRWDRLTATFSLLTTAGAAMGFAIGSWTPSADLATTAGIPILVILMVVGVINPSGVDSSAARAHTPLYIRFLKDISPFRFCIEALCLGEYPGMQFVDEYTMTNDNQRNKRRGLLGSLMLITRHWWGRVSNLPRMGALAMVRNGDQVIEALGLEHQTWQGAMRQLAILTAGNLFLSWMGLVFHQLRRQKRNPYSLPDAGSPAKTNTTHTSVFTRSKSSSASLDHFAPGPTLPKLKI